MAITDQTRTNVAFKSLQGKARGNDSTPYYAETIPRKGTTHADQVWLSDVPRTPPSSSTEVVARYYPDAEGEIVLTMDRAVAGGRKWVALDRFEGSWSSGSGDVSRVQGGWIAPEFGAQYVAQLYDGAGQRIPELDASDWMFDYAAGVLTFNSQDRAESGTSAGQAIKLRVFRYIGHTLGSPPDFEQTYIAARDGNASTSA